MWAVTVVLVLGMLAAAGEAAKMNKQIKIDGKFDDWAGVPRRYDPFTTSVDEVMLDGFPLSPDVHDTEEYEDQCANRSAVFNENVDVVETALAHNSHMVFAYFRAVGPVGKTIGTDTQHGRSYIQVNLDLDNDMMTGYCPTLGGYYPQNCGADVAFEIEMYDGGFNTGHIILHAHKNASDVPDIQAEIISGRYRLAGPALPYKLYEEWVYYDHEPSEEERTRCEEDPKTESFYEITGEKRWLCFVSDTCNGPYTGVFQYAFSEDETELEFGVPFDAFLRNADTNEPNLKLGMSVVVQMNIEASGELATPNSWSSDAILPFSYTFEGDDDEGRSETAAAYGTGFAAAGVAVGAAGSYMYMSRRAKYSEIPV